MDSDTVRERAVAFCDALDAGNIEAARDLMSPELQRNLGEVLALFPLPSSGSDVVSVDRGGSGYNVVMRLAGGSGAVELLTRWRDRDGEATLVEASHLSRAERVAEDRESEAVPGEDEPTGVERSN